MPRSAVPADWCSCALSGFVSVCGSLNLIRSGANFFFWIGVVVVMSLIQIIPFKAFIVSRHAKASHACDPGAIPGGGGGGGGRGEGGGSRFLFVRGFFPFPVFTTHANVWSAGPRTHSFSSDGVFP